MTVRAPKPLLLALALLLAAGAGALATYVLTDDSETASSAPSYSPSRAADVRVLSQCRSLEARPAEVIFTCADAGVVADHLRWKNWGGEVAVAEGTVLAHNCTPNCAASNHYDLYPVVLVAEDLKQCAPGDRRYTKVAYAWPAGSPYPPDAPGSEEPYLAFGCRNSY
jgi:hypothetical protein